MRARVRELRPDEQPPAVLGTVPRTCGRPPRPGPRVPSPLSGFRSGAAPPRGPSEAGVRSDRHVTIRVDGRVVAESDRARLLFETGLPPRYYLPAEDVDPSVLEDSDTVTRCPYKGTTSRYHSLRVGDRLVEDAIWVYDHPHDEVRGIGGLLAFYDDKVDIEAVPTRWVVPAPTT